MIKITRDMAVVMLRFFEEADQATRQRFLDTVSNYSVGCTAEMITETLSDQVYQDGREETDSGGTLIDAMADILSTNLSRNYLTGETLSELRRKILLPSERSNLQRLIRSRIVHCAGCKRAMGSYETCTIYNSGEVGSEIYCVRCVSPKYIACTTKKCQGSMPLSKAIVKQFSKLEACPKCLGVKEEPVQVVPDGELPENFPWEMPILAEMPAIPQVSNWEPFQHAPGILEPFDDEDN